MTMESIRRNHHDNHQYKKRSFLPSGISKPVNAGGTVHAEYKGTDIAALCVFRKKSAEGSLKVEIFKDNKPETVSETSQPYGIISLGKMPETNSLINQILGKILG
jgi:hypothetical protein